MARSSTPDMKVSALTDPRLIAIGVDHRTAPIDLREKVSYSQGQAEQLLTELVATQEISEACLLSTCNRTELYLRPQDEASAYRTGLEKTFLTRVPEIEEEGRFYVKRDHQAAHHLMEVASGLQSMVLGEPEILGQVKQATGLAETLGASGTVLRKLLRTAISAGGRVRHETGIGTGAVSFGYSVVDLARNIFRQLETCSVLLLGAGDIARQVARSLTEKGSHNLLVANRSQQRAEAFCEEFPMAQILPFEDRFGAYAKSDIIVASTGANDPVVLHDDIVRAMAQRKTRPMLLADLGMPRNIESAAGTIGNVFLQDIDSLEDLISHNLKKRREEIPRVQEILDRELAMFVEWHQSLAAAPVVAKLQKQAEEIRRQAVESAQHRFPEDLHGDLEKLTRSLVRKLLHHPSQKLRQGKSVDANRIDLVRHLFQLDDE